MGHEWESVDADEFVAVGLYERKLNMEANSWYAREITVVVD
jgi:hypothetical protein